MAENISHALLQYEGKGWKIDLFVNDNVKNEYVCYYCENICQDAVELSCDIDHDDDNIQLYCQSCLISVISSNGNRCPIDNHQNPKYSSTRRIRAKINKAKVLCPNSLKYQKQIQLNDINKPNQIIDTLDEKEGANPNNIIIGNIEQTQCNFDGVLTELMQHISKCCEKHLNSPEMQTEIIKLLQKDIKDLKNQNNQIKNALTEFKTENTNINQKYEQQKVAINKLENIIKSQNNNQKFEEQNKRIIIVENDMNKQNEEQNKIIEIYKLQEERINKLEKDIKLQNYEKRFVEQNERINKLENIIKTQNDLISSMIKEPKEEKQQISIHKSKKQLKFNTVKHGNDLQFINGNIVKKINRNEYELCFFGEEITNKMCKQFDIHIKYKKCRNARFVMGYTTSSINTSVKRSNEILGNVGGNKKHGVSYYCSGFRNCFRRFMGGVSKDLSYKASNGFKQADTFKFSFNFVNHQVVIYHNGTKAETDTLLNDSNKFTFAIMMYNNGDEVEITNYEYL